MSAAKKTNAKTTNVLMSGVDGQGVLAASETLACSDQTLEPIRIPGMEKPYPQGVPALQTAVELGNKRCANVVLLGAFAAGRQLRAEVRG